MTQIYADALEHDLFGAGWPDDQWQLGYFIPVVRSISSTSTFHAPASDCDRPRPACGKRTNRGEWEVQEWWRYRLFREPCASAACQQRFAELGLAVHADGRDGQTV